ncbi:MAG: hypothetical protein ABF301_04515 [Sulfurovum sp.]|jgi:hypothetical protein
MLDIAALDTIDFALICLLTFILSITIIEVFYYFVEKYKEDKKM